MEWKGVPQDNEEYISIGRRSQPAGEATSVITDKILLLYRLPELSINLILVTLSLVTL